MPVFLVSLSNCRAAFDMVCHVMPCQNATSLMALCLHTSPCVLQDFIINICQYSPSPIISSALGLPSNGSVGEIVIARAHRRCTKES